MYKMSNKSPRLGAMVMNSMIQNVNNQSMSTSQTTNMSHMSKSVSPVGSTTSDSGAEFAICGVSKCGENVIAG